MMYHVGEYLHMHQTNEVPPPRRSTRTPRATCTTTTGRRIRDGRGPEGRVLGGWQEERRPQRRRRVRRRRPGRPRCQDGSTAGRGAEGIESCTRRVQGRRAELGVLLQPPDGRAQGLLPEHRPTSRWRFSAAPDGSWQRGSRGRCRRSATRRSARGSRRSARRRERPRRTWLGSRRQRSWWRREVEARAAEEKKKEREASELRERQQFLERQASRVKMAEHEKSKVTVAISFDAEEAGGGCGSEDAEAKEKTRAEKERRRAERRPGGLEARRASRYRPTRRSSA